MDPSSASTCNRKKRKNIDPAAHDTAKRVKTAQEGDETPQCRRSSGSSRVCVLPDRIQHPITVNELTELLHYAALGKTGGVKQPSWCRLLHQKRVKAVNVVIVEGLTQSHFYKHYLTLQHLRTNYTARVTFTPSSSDLASEIFSSEVPKSDDPSLFQKRSESSQLHKALRSHPVITKFGTQRKGLTAYVLSQEEMIKKHFPVRGMPGFEEFVCLDAADCVTDSSPLYGLDCEMLFRTPDDNDIAPLWRAAVSLYDLSHSRVSICAPAVSHCADVVFQCLTEKGYELARVSLVDSDGNCVLDELVRPQNRILNYLTRFSGITRAMLRPISTTLRDVQEKLKMLLPSDAVLVGHSLDNDLRALKLIHQHVIDTSLLYRRDFGQKFKLKVLAETLLKRQIQTEDEKGHNPTEDAEAALELAQYFIKTGPCQVVELHLEELWGYTIVEESNDCEPAPPPSHRFAKILQTLGRSVAFSGKRSDVTLDLSNQLWHNSDKEVLASFRRQTRCPFLSVLQFSSFSSCLKRCLPHHQEQQHQRMCANLRDMCVVFAGPFPAGFSEKEVRRLFRCFGPVRTIKMLDTAVRVHAKVEFEQLEGALLALKTMNGLNLQGQPIKVQRPVYESMLDLDLTLNALRGDCLNTSSLYAVKLNCSMVECMNVSPKVNGHTLHAKSSGVTAVTTANMLHTDKVNGTKFKLKAAKSKMSEETVRETFAHFGTVERVVLPSKPGKHARHAFIKFQSAEDKRVALSSSEDLWKENYLVCPSLTPPHLPLWVAMATPTTTMAEDEGRSHMHTSSEDQEVNAIMRKLDRRLHKLFRSLPDGTLSVVVLPGHTSSHGLIPGLCLMEVKQGSEGER